MPLARAELPRRAPLVIGSRRGAAALMGALSLLACHPPDAGSLDAGSSARPTATVVAPAATDAPVASPAPLASAPAPREDGAPCTHHDDCASGICEGPGCGPDGGRCQAPVRCRRDRVAFCGCDGVTLRRSSNCPRTQFAHRGACEDEAPVSP